MKNYKLHWLGGKTEVVAGTDIADACLRAGYGSGAIRALDYYEELESQCDHACARIRRKAFDECAKCGEPIVSPPTRP